MKKIEQSIEVNIYHNINFYNTFYKNNQPKTKYFLKNNYYFK